MQEKTKAFNVLKALYSSQDTLPKLIEDEQIKALSLDEYYIKLQILLSEDNDSVKAALRDKVIGEKKPVEIEDIFKAIDVENRIRELLEKNYQVQKEIIDNIIKPLIEEENKLNLLYRNISNKSESEIKNIAESINRIQADVGKVLLLGGAGIGKTTLMHYLSYKWGKDNLWNDKFDYVFRIKLKELLNENWSREYEAKELRQNKLACFIHYCLNLENIEPHEIINISNKDRVLLLLDGYDEVAFLSQDNRDYRDIMEAVFQYKNVIMSSRPNAITENINNKFERKVENTGWDSEGIKKYVYKSFEYDKEFGTPLKSFLDTHSQIKEICEVPINTALICLIWSDPKIRDKFRGSGNENFNISRLYGEIIEWLNNRYLAKTQHKYKNKTEANNHLKNIMRFLEKIAYESLNTTGKLVENKRVENNKDTLDIDEVIEQGLLRREGQNYQFIHLTFQEFLAARYLKNHLLDNHTKSKTANFIGEHRNEPKYLMTLKFLAGIASNDDSQELTKIFWEAATCNVNGILEGIEKKITLLMHLLAQSKINGEFDNRIPHLKQIQNLIDNTVLRDITLWEQHIIDSEYLSEEIVRMVNEKLRYKKVTSQELKTAVEIIAALANRNEWGSKTKVYENLINSLGVEDIQLQRLVLQKLAEILDETIDKKVVHESSRKIILLLNKEVLNKYIKIILSKTIIFIPDLSEEVFNKIQKLKIKFLNKTLIITVLTEVLIVMPTQKAVNISKKLLVNPKYELRFVAATGLFEIAKAMPTQEAFIILKELFVNPDNTVKHVVARNLTEIMEMIPSLIQEAFGFLKELIVNPNTRYNLKSEAITNIAKIVRTTPSLAYEAFIFLKEIIISLKPSKV